MTLMGALPRNRTGNVDRVRLLATLDNLTAREREVLALLAEGLTDRGIGEHLWVTRKTVETHIRHILTKLNVPNGPQHNRRVLAAVAYLHADPGAATATRAPSRTVRRRGT